jgi:integration host factor subunit beta
MTKADLIDEVSRLTELTRKDSEVIVETIFESVVRSLRAGDKIEIRGFGSFEGHGEQLCRSSRPGPGRSRSPVRRQRRRKPLSLWLLALRKIAKFHPAHGGYRCTLFLRIDLEPKPG